MAKLRGKAGSTAVMARRAKTDDDDLHAKLDFYPTPPWATRALIECVFSYFLVGDNKQQLVWDPCAGEGHMSEVLREYFGRVYATDVHHYDRGNLDLVGSFVGEGIDRAVCALRPDWVVFNPPFGLADAFLARALAEAKIGVAMLARTQFVEGEERWREIFRPDPYAILAPFAERVSMVKGRWDPEIRSATSYAWFIWIPGARSELRVPVPGRLPVVWTIPPGQRQRLTKPEDIARFAKPAETPLLERTA